MVWIARVTKTQGFWTSIKLDYKKYVEALIEAMPDDSDDLWKVRLRAEVCVMLTKNAVV